MNPIYLKIKSQIFRKIKGFLFQDAKEHVVFLLITPENQDNKIVFEVKDFYLVPKNELDQTHYSVKLKYNTQAKIIKWAWDNEASLGEVHSHPFSKQDTAFSYSDLWGLKEFVPHVWWRLKNKPYIAIVFGKRDYDALVWIDNPNTPQKLQGILVDSDLFEPTNNTIFNFESENNR